MVQSLRVSRVEAHRANPDRGAQHFPRTDLAVIMLGFYATATSTAIRLNSDELDDARWFHRDSLRNPSEAMRLPRPTSISRRLLEDWLDGAG